MNDEDFSSLKLSLEQAVAISRGELAPARVTTLETPDVQEVRQQLKFLAARAICPPHQSDLSRRMFSVQWPSLNIGAVQQSRIHRHFRDDGEPKAIVDHLHQRMQGCAEHRRKSTHFWAVTGGEGMVLQAMAIDQQKQPAFVD